MDDYYDLGAYKRTVTTSSPQTQLWFDRGLNWLYGFNHAEAIKCFEKALETDPGCAMAHWGISYAAGPNYNLPWHRYDPAGKARALEASYDALQRALAAAPHASPIEQALIRELALHCESLQRTLQAERQQKQHDRMRRMHSDHSRPPSPDPGDQALGGPP